MIKEREECRAAKDWSGADQIRDKLRELGVAIYDKPKYWTDAEGNRYNVNETDNDNSNEGEIATLILNRERARKAKDWSDADNLRRKLKDMNVSIHDKEKVWIASGMGLVGLIPEWGGSSSEPKLPSRIPQEGVNKLIRERENSRASKDWARADQIRDVLKQVGITFHDKQGTWKSLDGMFGSTTDVVSSVGGSSGYSGAALGLQNQQLQLQALQQMQQQMVNPNLGNPNLQSAAMNVNWMSGQNPYVDMVAGAGAGAQWGMPQQGATSIESLVAQREKARYDKNFKLADMVRDQLKELGVQLSDKEKVWTSTDGQSGKIPSFSEVIGQ